jgi:hypothetical protein
LSSYTPCSREINLPSSAIAHPASVKTQPLWMAFVVSSFLVSGPVFLQAPLVRLFPEISLLLTTGWLIASVLLCRKITTQWWGDILIGFSWTWLAGSIYWGWFRSNPYIHLPIEAIALPIALLCLRYGWAKVGSWFYLGSLFGTMMTDLYFYVVHLIPYWQKLMFADPEMVRPIFQGALSQVSTFHGVAWAGMLVLILLMVGLTALRFRDIHYWAFGGAVLSTILVDGLFWIAAIAA